jgi:hypothetical protein
MLRANAEGESGFSSLQSASCPNCTSNMRALQYSSAA